MKIVNLIFRAVFYIPEWVYGREVLLKFFFMYMMINAMHKAHIAPVVPVVKEKDDA